MRTYSELLQDKRWQDKKKEILERDGYECRKCHLSGELEVHHVYYIAGLKPWEYDNESLITLCHDHHAEINDINKIAGIIALETVFGKDLL